MSEVLVEQVQRDRPQSVVGGADLSEDVDAVLVVFDHLRDATHLALDTPQTFGVVVFLRRVTVCGCHLPLQHRGLEDHVRGHRDGAGVVTIVNVGWRWRHGGLVNRAFRRYGDYTPWGYFNDFGRHGAARILELCLIPSLTATTPSTSSPAVARSPTAWKRPLRAGCCGRWEWTTTTSPSRRSGWRRRGTRSRPATCHWTGWPSPPKRACSPPAAILSSWAR